MTRMLVAAVAMAGLMACGEGAAGDGTPQSVGEGVRRSLGAGTRIDATTEREISSRSEKAGGTFTARVTNDALDGRGRIVMPAGSTLNLSITDLQASTDKGQADGRITVVVSSATVGGITYPLSATLTAMSHTLEGRGVGAAEVQKTAAGAAIGAITGRIIGGDTKGTVVGAVVGGAAGAVIAAQTANRDVVVPAGTSIVVTLDEALTVTAR